MVVVVDDDTATSAERFIVISDRSQQAAEDERMTDLKGGQRISGNKINLNATTRGNAGGNPKFCTRHPE
jgi:hypothetical protein